MKLLPICLLLLPMLCEASRGLAQTSSLSIALDRVCYRCPGFNNNPVCGTNGRTYDCSCAATKRRVPIACYQRCPCQQSPPVGCLCPEVYDPVCGVNGKTYSNACKARCAHVRVKHQGPCRQVACRCSHRFDPVCGFNGRTYGNSCKAGCENVHIRCHGKCPCF